MSKKKTAPEPAPAPERASQPTLEEYKEQAKELAARMASTSTPELDRARTAALAMKTQPNDPEVRIEYAKAFAALSPAERANLMKGLRT